MLSEVTTPLGGNIESKLEVSYIANLNDRKQSKTRRNRGCSENGEEWSPASEGKGAAVRDKFRLRSTWQRFTPAAQSASDSETLHLPSVT